MTIAIIYAILAIAVVPNLVIQSGNTGRRFSAQKSITDKEKD